MGSQIINYLLRFMATIGLSSVICLSLSWISIGVLYLVMTLIPRFLGNMFKFSAAEIGSDVLKNQLIPGWGYLSSIVNDPNFSTRLSIIISVIVVVIALFIVGFFVYLLMKVVEENKFFTIIFSVIAVMLFLFTIITMYAGEDFYGIEKGWGYYMSSVVLLSLLAIIKIGIGTSLWKGGKW